ncbi:MAG: hypothetical protein VB050_12875 [Geobacteraceae bacterium]|nr:hypothetical protein [Geobacteraceae bacterium]
MIQERDKIAKAKEMVQKMAGGTNPLDGQPLEDDCFLHDPRMVRCLHFVQEVLRKALEEPYRTGQRKPAVFAISGEEKKRIQLPKGKIGINEFARCVNEVIDTGKSRKLTGIEINRQLKKMGVLGEQILDDGKTRTVVGAESSGYGIESEKRNQNGNEYEMVLFNEDGKRYLLENIETIMAYTG